MDISRVFLKAIHHGHHEVVVALATEQPQLITPVDETRLPPIYVAARHGHTEVVRFLLAKGASPDTLDEDDGYACLESSVHGGHLECARVLVEAGANLEYVSPDGCTALQSAVAKYDLRTTKFLVDANADPNHCTSHGSPLALACERAHLQIVRTLLLAKADVELSGRDSTPILIAADEGSPTICELLLSFGAKPDALARFHSDILERMEAPAGSSLHHLVVNSVARTRALLRNGADIHESTNGSTPLDKARKMRDGGVAPNGSSASLVLQAAEEWGKSNHHLFPLSARVRARELIFLGSCLARQWPGMDDVWTTCVLPKALLR